jgi:predicted DNA-binding transcriptional regulator YafY
VGHDSDVANTSSRTLRLLPLLQTHRYWPGRELADRLGVSPRTLRRDVDRLRELGYPVEARRGLDGGYQLAPGAALPPLVLDDDEAVALAVALLAGAQHPVIGTAEASVHALTKVVQVMPKRLRRRVEALRSTVQSPDWADRTEAGPPLAAEVLTAVAQACRDVVRLDFDYTPAGGTPVRRHTEPHRLVPVGRRWYLVAYDLTRHDWRSFRLDRLTAPSAGTPFAPRRLPAEDAATYVRDALARAPQPYTITAEVDADAETVRGRIGRWAAVTATGPGSCRLAVNAESYEWATVALLTAGAEFRVDGPPEFAEHLVQLAGRLARAGAPSPGGAGQGRVRLS